MLTENGPELFLDISDRVTNSGERGLLGMAWHPTDPDRLFLHYSDLNGDTTISEFIDGEERLILKVAQPASNHNGGMIEVHSGSADGPLISSVTIPPGHTAGVWKEFTSPITGERKAQDLYFVCKAVGAKKNNLFDIDWMYFSN